MKKLSQRAASVLVALPLLLGSSVVLSSPAQASKYDACELLPPQPREMDPVTGEPIGLPSAVYECEVAYVAPPAPEPVSNIHSRGVEAYASEKVPSAMAEYYRVQSEDQRQQAVMMAWFMTAAFVACSIALAVIIKRSRNITS